MNRGSLGIDRIYLRRCEIVHFSVFSVNDCLSRFLGIAKRASSVQSRSPDITRRPKPYVKLLPTLKVRLRAEGWGAVFLFLSQARQLGLVHPGSFFLNELVPTEVTEAAVTTERPSNQLENVASIAKSVKLGKGEFHRTLGVDSAGL